MEVNHEQEENSYGYCCGCCRSLSARALEANLSASETGGRHVETLGGNAAPATGVRQQGIALAQ